MKSVKKYDVFLCHNSEDKPEIRQIAHRLAGYGIRPWFDEQDLIPGMSWQKVLNEQISQIGSAAVFVGRQGFGPWQQREVEAFLIEFVNRGCPVIPVLLRNAPQQPPLPILLKSIHWVDFRQTSPDPMIQLISGIKQIEPSVLIAQLRERSRPLEIQPLRGSPSSRSNTQKPSQSAKLPVHRSQPGHFQRSPVASPPSNELFTLLQRTGLFYLLVVVIWIIVGYLLKGILDDRNPLPMILISGALGGALTGFFGGLSWHALKPTAPLEEAFVRCPLLGLIIGAIGWLLLYLLLGSNLMRGQEFILGGLMGIIASLILARWLYNIHKR